METISLHSGERPLRRYAILFGGLLLLWGAAALYLEKKSERAEREYLEKAELTGRYEALRSLWSPKARREARTQVEKMLGIYGITPKTQKRGNLKSYLFTVDAKRVDTILGKILGSNLTITSFTARKSGDDTLEVRLEIEL